MRFSWSVDESWSRLRLKKSLKMRTNQRHPYDTAASRLRVEWQRLLGLNAEQTGDFGPKGDAQKGY